MKAPIAGLDQRIDTNQLLKTTYSYKLLQMGQNPPSNLHIINADNGFWSFPGHQQVIKYLQVELAKSRSAGAPRSDD